MSQFDTTDLHTIDYLNLTAAQQAEVKRVATERAHLARGQMARHIARSIWRWPQIACRSIWIRLRRNFSAAIARPS